MFLERDPEKTGMITEPRSKTQETCLVCASYRPSLRAQEDTSLHTNKASSTERQSKRLCQRTHREQTTSSTVPLASCNKIGADRFRCGPSTKLSCYPAKDQHLTPLALEKSRPTVSAARFRVVQSLLSGEANTGWALRRGEARLRPPRASLPARRTNSPLFALCAENPSVGQICGHTKKLVDSK